MIPTVPERARAGIWDMAFCLTMRLRNNTALWAVAVLEMRKPIKMNRASGTSSGRL